MRKIESLFIGISLIAIIATIGGQLHHLNNTNAGGQHAYNFPSSKYGNFLAAQHAIYINDFVAASDFTANLADVDYPIVQNTRLISEFLGGKLPENAHLLKNEKSMPAQLIYDAYLVQQGKWKELHNRHKTDKSALAAPLRIWSAIANDWRTNTFNFIDDLSTNKSWKSFIRGQIYAELDDKEKAIEHFEKVSPEFMNINDYMYIMAYYKHIGRDDLCDALRDRFTEQPGGMFIAEFDNIPDWSVYAGLENALAFSLVQNVSHTQIMMYSDLAIILLRFAEITAPDFSKNSDAIHYYLGQFFYNNIGDYQVHFDKIKTDSPFYLFAVLRSAEKNGDISKLEEVTHAHPLFVPAVNKLIAHHIQHGNKRRALRIIQRAIDNENLNDQGRAFFLKSRAQIYYAFGDLKAAQQDIHDASDTLMIDAEIVSLQAKIWAAQGREIENAYDYAMMLVKQNPADILAWDTLGYVISIREGAPAALDVLERVGEVSETCSSLFEHMGDMYVEIGEYDNARNAYKRAIDLSDDGLTVVPNIERKIRKIK